VEAFEGRDEKAFLSLYREAMLEGSRLRKSLCDVGEALPVGENIDDEYILASLRERSHRTEFEFRVIFAAENSVFHQMRPMLTLQVAPKFADRVMTASDQARHGVSASRGDFESALRSLKALDACVLERHAESMALIRTTHPISGDSAFLVCDSHFPSSGGCSLTQALEYVFRLIPNADFPLVFTCLESE
jgi:hypothetical protein